ncbi:hypothetical protein A1OE_1273 [Candidatus Endolissoclinum faulkneri L2]|uniref:Uncharacterized protein n=1 Tax=Candidatus Endolissoclinum faulkneri L2 TaxID=1193729 RepID=K7YPL9_9PROT|nr:hypothetical protein A1OE_1273 [Candidatus Endolissoclinum faulkneri L2]
MLLRKIIYCFYISNLINHNFFIKKSIIKENYFRSFIT